MQNSILAILLAMLISRKPVQRRGIGEKCGFFAPRRPLPILNKVTTLLQIGFFRHKKGKFAHFNTKQVCNVKKKNFQCLINVNGNFLIWMIEISVE